MTLQASYMEQELPRSFPLTPEMFIEKLIGRIWMGFLSIWEQRNEVQHHLDLADNSTTSRLHSQITAIYDQASSLPAMEQFPFQSPQEDLFKLPIAQQHDWIERHRSYVVNRTQAQAERDRTSTRPIYQYFQARPRPIQTDDPDLTPEKHPP